MTSISKFLSLCLIFIIFFVLASSGIAQPRNDYQEPTVLFETLEEVYRSAEPEQVSLVNAWLSAYQRTGDCVDYQFDSDDTRATRASMSTGDYLRTFDTVIEGEVLKLEPGMRDRIAPATVITIQIVNNKLSAKRNHLHAQTIAYQINALDTFLPTGERLCFRESSPPVPKIGERVFLFVRGSDHNGLARRGRGLGFHDDWIFQSDDVMIIEDQAGELRADSRIEGRLRAERSAAAGRSAGGIPNESVGALIQRLLTRGER